MSCVPRLKSFDFLGLFLELLFFCRFRSFARSRLNSRAVSVVSSSASNMEAVRGLGVVPFSVVVAVSSAFSSSLTESGVEENALL